MNKTLKKTLSIIITILMIMATIPFAFAADIVKSGICGERGDNVTWTLDSNGILTISGTGAMADYKDETPVLPYPPYFSDRTIKTVVIEEGVTRIGECAFNQCEAFTSITIPDSITSVGTNAFLNCYSLTSVSVPCTWGSGNMLYYFSNNVKVTVREHSLSAGICTVCQYECEHSFEDNTCMLCGIKIGTCGDNVTWRLSTDGLLIISGEGDMYDYDPQTSPFYRNEEIKAVVIEDGVTVIGYDTFEECENLESVTIGNSVATIKYSAFMCPQLTSVSVPCTWNSENPIYYFDEDFVEVTLREHSFEDGTCTVCGVTCEALGHVIKNGTCIGCGRVGTCGAEGDNLTWTLDNDGLLTISGTGDMADYFFKSDTNIKTVVIEDGVTSIGIEAFAYCNNLESITIPDSVKSIGGSAFKLCTSLKSITIPDSVTSMGQNMFYNCTSLESVTIGNGATSIGRTTFYLCTSLKSITIGNGIKIIDIDAFTSCPSLTYVHYLGTSSQWDKIDIYYFFDNNIKLQNATRHYCTEKEAIDVTCTEAGYTAGWYCADCEEYVVSGEETAALGHDYDVTKSENNLTRPTLLSLAPGIAGLIDGGWLDGYYTYTCKNGCGTTTTETAKRADYTAFDTAMNDYDAIVNDETVLDSVKNELLSIYQQNADVTVGNRIETEQAEVDAVVRLISEKIVEIKAEIEDGTAIKADYTAIDEAIDAIDDALENATISEDMANELADIKADLAELKEDVNTSVADLANSGLLDRAEAITETMDNCANGTHSFTNYETTEKAKCGVAGKEEAKCDNGCGATDENDIPALEHVDKDGDYVCDNGCGHEFEKPVDPTPDTPDEPTDTDCDHLCHSDNAFIQFIWKIVNFIQKLFGMEQTCDCGVTHW